MRFIDAHIHLSDPEYNGKTNAVVEEAKQAGVVAMVSNSMNLATCEVSLRLAKEHAGSVYAALGIHPWSVNQLASNELEQTIDFISRNAHRNEEVVAIGEVGLDPQYGKRKAQREQQTKVFNEMLRLAEKLILPVIVHSRWSAHRIIEILPSYKLKGVLWHWYSTPTELLPKIVERGNYVSEGPPITFSERIQEVIRLVPLENLLTETDGPVQYHGQFKDAPTTPAFIPEVVKALAKIKSTDETTLAEQVLHNFTKFFNVNL